LSAGSPPQTPLGELTALPQIPSWILGGLLLRGGEGTRGEGKGKGGNKEGRDGEGGAVSPPKLKLAPPQNYFPVRLVFIAHANI